MNLILNGLNKLFIFINDIKQDMYSVLLGTVN